MKISRSLPAAESSICTPEGHAYLNAAHGNISDAKVILRRAHTGIICKSRRKEEKNILACKAPVERRFIKSRAACNYKRGEFLTVLASVRCCIPRPLFPSEKALFLLCGPREMHFFALLMVFLSLSTCCCRLQHFFSFSIAHRNTQKTH